MMSNIGRNTTPALSTNVTPDVLVLALDPATSCFDFMLIDRCRSTDREIRPEARA